MKENKPASILGLGTATQFDATDQHHGAVTLGESSTIRITEAPEDRTRLQIVHGGAGNVTTTSTTEPSQAKSSTPKLSKRAHFLTSATQLVEGQRHESICGAVVENSRWVAEFDLNELDKTKMPTYGSICGKCFLGLAQRGQRYIYLAVNDQVFRFPEDAA